MPASFRIDPARRLVVSRAWGVLHSGDIRDFGARLLADAAFDPTFGELIDLRSLDRMEASCDVLGAAARQRVYQPHTRRAIVVASPLAYGLARVFAAHGEMADQQIRVFHDLVAACAWIGLPEMDLRED